MKDDFVTELDLGTSKTCVLLGKRKKEDKCEIIGVGHIPTLGLKKGVVIDLRKAIATIEKVVEEAERPRNLTAHSLFVNISGGHIKGINCQGAVEITNKNQEILKENIENSIRVAKASCISTERGIVTTIPQ
ncbi:MAG: cell division protein FtsA, partial [Candidatus Omnitrophica bacterium]|nr:cell division protein FtsA [Candidatus Omnitrophota bacterium]